MLKSVVAFNASPRINWNTAQLLKEALKGAQSIGAKTELIHLKDVNFSGCMSCLACKKLNAPPGLCAINDDFSAIKEKIEKADAIILGTPIYFCSETALARKFIERALFPFAVYGPEMTNFHKKIKTGLIYTMNVDENTAKERGYLEHIAQMQLFFSGILGLCEILPSFFTQQVKDYAKYNIKAFDPQLKYKQRNEQFPIDLKKAFDLGKKLIQ